MCEEKERFKVPNWATMKPPSGSHLDVVKSDSLIQKLLIDEKPVYYFGRNPTHCDFIIEHASSSRVHAMLAYHSLLKKFALVDLKSSHGTFVKGVRVAPLQPIFIELNEDFSFGASTRKYIIRSKLETSTSFQKEVADLPEKEYDLDNLTNYNTMQNRRIPTIPITLEEARRKSKKRGNVVFLKDEEIINPEDVDPSIGRFRNLIKSAVVGGKRKASDQGNSKAKRNILLPGKDDASSSKYTSVFGPAGLNAAPSLDLYSNVSPVIGPSPMPTVSTDDESAKKKYKKEAWPGQHNKHSAI